MDRDRQQEFEDDLAEQDKYSAADNHLNRAAARMKKINGYYTRASVSLPDVTSISLPNDANASLYMDGIPPGLPRLHTLPQGII